MAILAGCANLAKLVWPAPGKKRIMTWAVAGMCSGLLWLSFRAPPEPTYEGRTLSEWLLSSDYDTARHRVEFAILSMGETAVPALKRLLRSGSKFERTAYARAPQWVKWCWPRHRSLSQVRERALIGVRMLRWDPRTFTHELTAMITDPTEFLDLRQRAMRLLTLTGHHHPDRSTVLSVLNQARADPDPAVSQTAFSLLLYEKGRALEDAMARLPYTRPEGGRAAMVTEVRSQKPLWAPLEKGLPLERVTQESDFGRFTLTNRPHASH